MAGRSGARAAPSRPPPRYAVLVGALLVGALALRLGGIAEQSLWYDEGTSAALSGRTAADILAAAAGDIHPPLYYLILAAWRRLTGPSVFALRALSAFAGTALVALVYALGVRLLGRRSAVAAAALAAAAPFLVWYAQELRMYTLGALLGAAMVWLALDLARRPATPPRLAAYAALAAAALYTQYLVGASALLAANLCFLAYRPRPWPRRGDSAARDLAAWAGVQGLALLLFAPWLPVAWPAIRDWPAVDPGLSAPRALFRGAESLALGVRVTPETARWLALVLLAPALGLATGLGRRRRRGTLVTLLYLLSPFLLLGALALRRPSWDPKFLIAAAPAFELLAGAGVAGLARLRPGFGLLGLLVLAAALAPRAAALHAVRTDPALQRDDYRAIAATIDRRAEATDAVVLTAPTQIEVFDHYDRGRHPAYPLPLGRRPPPEETRRRLAEIAARHRDLYAVLWAVDEADPQGVVEGWLNEARHKAFDRWHGNVRLALWAAAREPMEPWPDAEASLPLGFGDDEIRLHALTRTAAAPAPGGVLTLEATWSAGTTPPRADYVVFVHLVDEAGAIVAQRDMAPLGGTGRTSTWAAEPHRDRIALALPDDLGPGTYELLLGLYDAATGRLPVGPAPGVAKDALVVGRYEVPADAP